MAARVSAISSAPKGSPWALAVLARLGLPLPILVLQTMSVGLSAEFFALAIAWLTAATSWPLMASITFQP